MSPRTRSARLRWIAPVAAATLAVTVPLAVRGASAQASLGPRTAEQLLVDLQNARLDALSGTVVQTADLGLPNLPGVATGGMAAKTGAASLTTAISGTHTWRVWYAGEQRVRLALVAGSGESDVIRNGKDVWLWSSSEQSATHYTLPEKTGTATSHPTALPSPLPSGMPSGLPTTMPSTPQEAATTVLGLLDPTTKVTAEGTVQVAGRPAYELVLTPKDTSSKVAQVRIAIDGEKYVPLRVQVFSTAMSTPAIDVGFSDVDFATPEDRQFEFTPPAGTTVTQGTMPTESPKASSGTTTPKPSSGVSGNRPKVVGTGWTSVMVATMPATAMPSSGTTSGSGTKSSTDTMTAALQALPKVSGSWGSGRLLDGTLFTLVLTDDHRLAVGAVAPEKLYAALAAK